MTNRVTVWFGKKENDDISLVYFDKSRFLIRNDGASRMLLDCSIGWMGNLEGKELNFFNGILIANFVSCLLLCSWGGWCSSCSSSMDGLIIFSQQTVELKAAVKDTRCENQRDNCQIIYRLFVDQNIDWKYFAKQHDWIFCSFQHFCFWISWNINRTYRCCEPAT